jgi:hypothetical protein
MRRKKEELPMAESEKKTRKKKVTVETDSSAPAVASAQNDGGERIATAPAEPRNDKTERTYTESEVQAMIAALLAKQKKPEDDVVRLYFMNVCNKNNAAELPGYGVVRPGQYLEIPKKEFGGKFMSAQARKFIEKRRLLVLDGLNEEERRRWNCDYKRGETLTENAFDRLLDMPGEELLKLFKALCVEHKEFVARFIFSMVADAKENKHPLDNRISLSLVRDLNEASKADCAEGMLSKTVEMVKEMM